MIKKVFQFEDLEFWAQDGRVVVANLKKAEDETKKIYEVVHSVEPKEFLKRVIAIWVMHQSLLPSERAKANKLREEAEFVVKEALKQDAILNVNHVEIAPKQELYTPGITYKFKNKPGREILLNGYEFELA